MACRSIFIPLSDFLLCDQMGLKSNFDTTNGFTVTNSTERDAYLKSNTGVCEYLPSGTTSTRQTVFGNYAVLSVACTDKSAENVVYCNIQATEAIFEVLPGTRTPPDGQQITVTANFRVA